MSFDLAAARRRLRLGKRRDRLTRRADAGLPFIERIGWAGQALMIDTCVYVDALQNRAPPAIERVLATARLHHSAVCLAELTHLVSALDPSRAGTRKAIAELEVTIADIPERRLTAPSERAFGESGLLAGLVMRLTGAGQPRALQNDALLYLHAIERGLVLVTRNLRDFDFFDQLLPNGRVLFYRRAD